MSGWYSTESTASYQSAIKEFWVVFKNDCVLLVSRRPAVWAVSMSGPTTLHVGTFYGPGICLKFRKHWWYLILSANEQVRRHTRARHAKVRYSFTWPLEALRRDERASGSRRTLARREQFARALTLPKASVFSLEQTGVALHAF